VPREQEVKVGGHHKAVKMGLGDAIQRLMKVEHLYASGVTKVPAQMLEERDLIISALNDQFELNLGFDCNDDEVPDTVAIFQQTAQTSCCRILPTEIQKQVKKRGASGSRAEAQKKRPPEEAVAPQEDRVRVHKGLAKTSTPRPPSSPPPQAPPKEPPTGETVARIFRGLTKTTPEPSTA